MLLDFGAMFGPLIAEGQYWRLFTAMFLHVGLTHLIFNGIGLIIFGRLLERLYGHYRFAIIYVLAGLGGSVVSYLFNTNAIGAGASGAIFGVLGALVGYFFARRDVLGEMGRQNLTGILILAAINLAFGFVIPGIDNFAHLGGLFSGVMLGLAFAPRYRLVFDPSSFSSRLVDTNSVLRRWWVIPLTLAALGGFTWLGTATAPASSISLARQAERLLEQGDYGAALEEARAAIDLDPTNARAYYVRGRALVELGNRSAGLSQLVVARSLAAQSGDSQTFDDARDFLDGLGAR